MIHLYTNNYIINSQTCAPHWAQLQKLQLFEDPIVAFDSKTLNLL